MSTRRMTRWLPALAALIALLVMLSVATMPAFAGPDNDNGKKVGHGKQDQRAEDQSGDDESEAAEEESAEEESQGSEEAESSDTEEQQSSSANDSDRESGSQPTHGCDQANENDGDPYDSTCDGSPSENGNGGGGAGGKPCAGCVGAADNKNPPGQYPDGSDHNNGYECDGNSGVGKTNPAHTGCKPPENPVCVEDCSPPPPKCEDECQPPPPPCDENPDMPGIQPCNPPPCDKNPNMPGIQECVNPPAVLGNLITNPIKPVDVVQGEIIPAPETRPSRVLPFTGPDGVGIFVLAGLVLMVAGGSLLKLRRESA